MTTKIYCWCLSPCVCTTIYQNELNLSSHSWLTPEWVTLKSFIRHYCPDSKDTALKVKNNTHY